MINKYLLLIILLFLIYFITINSEESIEYENFDTEENEIKSTMRCLLKKV